MRKHKIIKIDEREIAIRELRVKDILEMLETIDRESLLASLEHNLPRFTDITLDELKDLAPSEIHLLVDAFKEVNADFLEAATRLQLGDLLEQIFQEMKKEFFSTVADSLKQAMSGALSTDGPSS